MNLIEPKVDVWGLCPTGQDAAMRWIERAARVCYNSEDKTKPGSAVKFIKGILAPSPSHSSVLEHSNIVLRSRELKFPLIELEEILGKLKTSFIFAQIYKGRVYLYGNYRAFYEYCRIIQDDFSFFRLPDGVPNFFSGYELVTNPEEIPEFAQAVTVCFTVDRTVTHEAVRHRHKTAFSQRSQRFCNESDLQIIKPYWLDTASLEAKKAFMISCYNAEDTYKTLKASGLKNQAARAVLPNCTVTTLVMTAYLSAWYWFFFLRVSSAADPSIQKAAQQAQSQMRHMDIRV